MNGTKQMWRAAGIGAGVLLAVAGIGWLAVERGPLAATEVSIAPVVTADLQPSVFGVGTVEARLAYAIGPTQAGRVLKVHVDHGDAVRAGQLVAEMDPVDLAERVRTAEAQVREAESRARTAQVSLARYRDLAGRKFISSEAAEARQNEAAVAESALAAVRSSALGARQQLANSRMFSPVSGIVTSREAEPGSTVVAGQSVVKIIDPGSLWIRARIDQSRARGVKVGQPAKIELRSARGSPLPGKVARIELQSDSVTEERIVAVQLDGVDTPLYPGELAEVTILLPPLAGTLAVPSAAVRRSGESTGVWQVAGGRAHFLPIEAGVQTGDGMRQVVKGLAAGDAVIVHSTALLQEGMRVRVRAALR